MSASVRLSETSAGKGRNHATVRYLPVLALTGLWLELSTTTFDVTYATMYHQSNNL